MNTAGTFERPPSPPQSNDGNVTLPELKSHTVPREPFTPPRSILSAAQPDAGFVSGSEGIEIAPISQYQDSYGDPSLYQTAAPASNFYSIQPTFVRTSQLSTPPGANEPRGISTRSGRSLGSPLTPNLRNSSRISRSPRMKTAPRPSKKKKATKGGAPLIDQPLSILTKDSKIPIKDTHAWVHRPASERQLQAVSNKNGHISRPMNSFMLYRSAYAERAKQFCKENNHQVVSQVTGASWPLEPVEIREMFEEYAKLERHNHAAAHPNYKFAPNKNGKKRDRFDDDDEDPEWKGSGGGKRSRTGTQGPSRSHSSTPFEEQSTLYQQAPAYCPQLHPSSYWASNPHGPLPPQIRYEGYYQPVANPYGQQIEDVHIGRMNNAFPNYDQTASLIGLPNNNHSGLLGHHGISNQMQGDLLDPQLLQEDPRYQIEHFETLNPGFEVPRTYEYSQYLGESQQYEYGPPVNYHPGMATLTDARDSWEEPGEPGAEFDQEFQRWR